VLPKSPNDRVEVPTYHARAHPEVVEVVWAGIKPLIPEPVDHRYPLPFDSGRSLDLLIELRIKAKASHVQHDGRIGQGTSVPEGGPMSLIASYSSH